MFCKGPLFTVLGIPQAGKPNGVNSILLGAFQVRKKTCKAVPIRIRLWASGNWVLGMETTICLIVCWPRRKVTVSYGSLLKIAVLLSKPSVIKSQNRIMYGNQIQGVGRMLLKLLMTGGKAGYKSTFQKIFGRRGQFYSVWKWYLSVSFPPSSHSPSLHTWTCLNTLTQRAGDRISNIG